jgi:hypothetical protein
MSPTHLLDALFLYLPLVEILPHEIDREREREYSFVGSLLHCCPDKGGKPEHDIKQAIREEATRRSLPCLPVRREMLMSCKET